MPEYRVTSLYGFILITRMVWLSPLLICTVHPNHAYIFSLDENVNKFSKSLSFTYPAIKITKLNCGAVMNNVQCLDDYKQHTDRTAFCRYLLGVTQVVDQRDHWGFYKSWSTLPSTRPDLTGRNCPLSAMGVKVSLVCSNSTVFSTHRYIRWSK